MSHRFATLSAQFGTGVVAGELAALAAGGNAPDWIKVTPAGRVTTRDGRSYAFDPAALVARFKADAIPIPIDLDHSVTLKSAAGESGTIAGWAVDLEARADGTYARVDWLDAGKATLRTETIGRATLYQGDALEILPTLERRFAAVLADPPYCSGGTTAPERTRATSAKYQSSEDRGLYPEFAGDTRDQRSFLAWSTLWLGRARDVALPGAICAVFSDWRQLPVTSDALQCAGWVWRGIVPWDKTEGSRPQQGRYRIQAEYVVWGTNGPRPLAGATAPGVFRMPKPHKKHHIAGKPVELMEGLLRPVDGPVLDPFMGSGTVGLACAARGLDYVGIEVEEAYYEVARRRLGDSTREEASRAP